MDGRADAVPVWDQLTPSEARLRLEVVRLGERPASSWPKTDLPPLFEPLSESDLSRRGYRPRVMEKWLHLGPRWAPGFTLWETLLPPEVLDDCLTVMATVGAHTWSTADQVFGTLKELSTLAKKGGDALFPQYWKFLVDLPTMTDYVPSGSRNARIADVMEWVAEDISHELLLADYSSLFRSGVAGLLSSAPHLGRALQRAQSVDEFVANRMTVGTGGSSSTRTGVTFLDKRGKSVKPRRTKAVSMLGLSSTVLRRWLLEEVSPASTLEVAREVDKSERGKARARSIIMSDDRTHWRMSFVGQVIEDMMGGSQSSTLWMSSRSVMDMWVRLRSTLGIGWRMPLDASSFDATVSAGELRVVMEEVIHFLSRSGQDERAHVAELIAATIVPGWSADSGGTVVDVAGTRVRVRKGVLSGWRWTAWMDTVVNLARVAALASYCARFGAEPPISVIGQGDDDQLTMRREVDGAALFLAYREANIDVNPSKFFLSPVRDEFLRVVVDRNGVAGYPGRGIGALLWSSPLSSRPRPGPDRVRSRFELWNLLAARGMRRDVCFNLAVEDAASGSEISQANVLRLAYTPATLGGIGVQYERLSSRKMLAATPNVREVHTVVSGISDDVGDWIPPALRTTTLQLYASTTLTLPGVSETWRRSSLERVERVDWGSPPLPTGGGMSVRAIYSNKSPLVGPMLQVASRELDSTAFRALAEGHMSDQSLLESPRVWTALGKSAWYKWVLDDMPVRSPIVWGVGPLSTALVFNDLAARSMASSVLRRGGMGMFKSLLLTSELSVGRELYGSAYSLGV